MGSEFGDKLEDLNLSNDEVKRLSECMKDKKFRDLLNEYAMEISDPANKKRYEEEIALMEKERGNDIRFVNPTPNHVLKTSKDGKDKIFVNICTSSEIGKPECKPSMQGSNRGMSWSIPHSLAQPREDFDKSKRKCMVYDIVFNPDTCRMAETNNRFHKMIQDIALDAVERNFQVKLDKVNVKKPKMKYKGVPQATVIRVPRKDKDQKQVSENSNDPLSFPYPPMKAPCKPSEPVKLESKNVTSKYVEPKHSFIHRGYFDIKNYYAKSDQTVASTRPRELVLNIELPLLKSASPLQLEIFKDHIFLQCEKPVKYKLDLKLPYPVDESKGSAKFDKTKKRLVITLEVLPPVLERYEPSFGDIQNEIHCEKENNVDDHVINDEPIENDILDSSSTPQTPLAKVDSDSCCGEKSHDEHVESSDALEEVKSQEIAYSPSSHPSSLVHGTSGCRYQIHGSSWDQSFNKKDKSTTLPSMVKRSSSLEEIKAKAVIHKNVKIVEPAFTYHQDDSFIVFIIKVRFIDPEMLSYSINCKSFKFSAMVEGLSSPEIYQLLVSFNGDDNIDPQRSRIDVSDDNAVFALHKHVDSFYEWQSLEAGMDSDTLRQLAFTTQENINDVINEIATDALNEKSLPFNCEDVSDSDHPDSVALRLTPANNVIDCTVSSQIGIDEKKVSNEDIKKEVTDGKKNTIKANSEPEAEKYQRNAECVDTDEYDDSANCKTDGLSEVVVESEDELSYEHKSEEKKGGQCNSQSLNNLHVDDDGSVNHSEEKSESDGLKLSEDSMRADQSKMLDGLENEPLFLHEHEQGSETKSQVFTNHKTKSIVKLSNDVLFELDSD